MSDRRAPDVSWQQLQAATPAAIRDAVPDVPWRLEALWRLTLPVRRIPIADLDWTFDLPLWQRDGVRFQVTPRAVLADPGAFPDHYQRILSSDPAYPIHVIRHRDRLVVLDGFHRLAKVTVQGGTDIDAMELSHADLAALVA
jgi:hypothetical protein